MQLKTKLTLLKKDSNIFRNINKITNRKPFPVIPALKSNDSVIIPDVVNHIEKINLLGQHFENTHSKNMHMGNADRTNHINRAITENFTVNSRQDYCELATFSQQFPSDGSQLAPRLDNVRTLTNVEEVKSVLKQLKSKKSCGIDNISSYILKKLPPPFLILITILFNNCLNIGYFPKSWKIAKILAFPKHGKDVHRPASYRPISLLSCISKIFESLIRNRIEDFADVNNIIPNFQFGFRKGHVTSHALAKFATDMTTSLSSGSFVVAVSLDIENAFDRVWIEGLMYKMKKIFNFPDFLVKIMFNYMNDRSFMVAAYNTNHELQFSNLFRTKAGTPQGSILAPLMYNIYLSDLVSCSPNLRAGSCNTVMFADDTIIYSSHN